ncbi:MAG: glycoside hydrolase family 127 protein [Anaerolineae bacterium]
MTYTPIDPRSIRNVGGFLGQRFHANRIGRLRDPLLVEQFIRLHEEKRYDDWFWMGEQIGKWLDAAAYSALIANDDELQSKVEEALERLSRAQEPDGYLGVTMRIHRNPVRGMELYEMYYVLHGLLVCAELLHSDTALRVAQRLGDYIVRTWGPDEGQFPLAGRFPGNGHDGGEGTLILEPIVRLGILTGDDRYVEWGERTLAKWDEWLAAYPESVHTCDYTSMRQFAAGEKDVYELREPIHAHTFHMTLLGLAALYEATGNVEYRDVFLGSVDRLAREWIFLTGGMSSTERYVPRCYYHPRNEIEVCPQHTWILMLDQALRWTGDPAYAAEIERDLFNHFLAAQLADGSNWSYFTPLNGRASQPGTPNCCNSSGQRIAGRMPVYLYGMLDGHPAINLFTQSQAQVTMADGLAVTLSQETSFPSDGRVRIIVDPERAGRFRLYVRIPPYVAAGTLTVNSEPAQPVAPGAYMPVERMWSPGDVVELALSWDVTCRSSRDWLAITWGSLVYALFQDVQDDPMIFHGRRGRYPDDFVVTVDPDELGSVVTLEAVPEGLVGPAMMVPARCKEPAPLFSRPEANRRLEAGDVRKVRLLPMVNQGAIRGEYCVFLSRSDAVG